MPELAWHTTGTAKADLGITVQPAHLAIAKEELLIRKGLAIGTATPPSESFAAAVVYQALANKQASQASTSDDLGGDNAVRLYPFDKKIMSMCIVPDVDVDDPTIDHSYVRSLIG